MQEPGGGGGGGGGIRPVDMYVCTVCVCEYTQECAKRTNIHAYKQTYILNIIHVSQTCIHTRAPIRAVVKNDLQALVFPKLFGYLDAIILCVCFLFWTKEGWGERKENTEGKKWKERGERERRN